MGKDRQYRDRLKAVLTKLEDDLTTVRAGIKELQDKDYRRALRWSGVRGWRRAHRHLYNVLRHLEWALKRIEHFISVDGWDLDAYIPMPGGVSHTRMTFAKWAESAYGAVRYHGYETEELVRTVKKCASLSPLRNLYLDMLTALSASMATDTLA